MHILRDSHIQTVGYSLLHPNKKVGLFHVCTDPAVVVCQLSFILLQSTVQLDDVSVLMFKIRLALIFE